MNIMAVICEYNPFHKGHEYQLKTHREKYSADGVICLMSGSFVQRGAPAVKNKWERAKDAILNGADLVLELPVVYSSQSAKRFSFGAVSLLDALGCVDFLSFGSESGDLDEIKKCAKIVFSDEFEAKVKEEMKTGISYPAARSKVLEKHFPTLQKDLLSSPNNILALEYVNALSVLNSKITPVTLKRNFEFESASKIREKMKDSEFEYSKDALDQMVSYHMRRETSESLAKIADVAEGLGNRFVKFSKTTYGADELSEAVKTKRYTKTRIDRIIINSLLGITDSDTELSPQYAKVLAFNDKGTQIIKEIRKKSKIPVITKVADAAKTNDDAFSRMLEKDILATDIYALLTKEKKLGLDFTTSPIYVK